MCHAFPPPGTSVLLLLIIGFHPSANPVLAKVGLFCDSFGLWFGFWFWGIFLLFFNTPLP